MEINENNLLKIGFIKEYSNHKEGFYLLRTKGKFNFSVAFSSMKLSIQVKGIGHIQELDNVKTIEDISQIIKFLT